MDCFKIFTTNAMVLHVVIVLGAVGSKFIFDKDALNSTKLFLVIFIIIKTIANLIEFRLQKKEKVLNPNVYI